MEFIKLLFTDGTLEVVKSKLQTIPYFDGLFNLNSLSKSIKLPFTSTFFIPLLFRKLEFQYEYDQEIIDETLHMIDYLSWDDGMNYFLQVYGKRISMSKSFSILYNHNTHIAKQLIKYHRNAIIKLIPDLERKQVVNLCELLQHSELSSLVIAVYKWSKINDDLTIWDDISLFSYGISNQTLGNILDITDILSYDVVRKNLKSIQIMQGDPQPDETELQLYWKENKFTIGDRDNYSDNYFDYQIVDNKLRITSKSYICHLIIRSSDNYLYVKLDNCEFDYLFLYDCQYVTIMPY